MRFLILVNFLLLNFFAFTQNNKVIDKIIAVVGDKIILKSDIEKQKIQLSMQGYSLSDNIDCRLMDELLLQNLLLYQAQIDSLNVSNAQVEAELERRINYFAQQIGSIDKLEEYYQKTVDEIKNEFKDEVRKQILIEQMRDKITSKVEITPTEVKTYFNSLPQDSLPLINSQLKIAQIVLYPKIPKEAKQEAYNKIKELRERILNGEKFSTLAILYSEDIESAKKGGELGFVNRKDLVTEFAAVAFKLKKGEVSKIVETQFGYHIIQLIERRGERINVRHILITPKVPVKNLLKTENKLDSIADLIEKDSLSFEEAAIKFSEDEESKKNGGILINPYTGTTKFEADQIDPSLFFIVDKLNPGEISKPVIFTDNTGKQAYRILKLLERIPPHKANLNDDYNKIKDAALANKKNNELNNWVNKKINETYIRIDNDYYNCNFLRKWIKNKQRNGQ